MFKSYFIASWRSLARSKALSLINIGGLSIGLACVLLITSYVLHELSYDRFHPNAENTYRITTDWINDGKHERLAMAFSPLSPLLTQNIAGVNMSVRIYPFSGLVSADKANKTRENKFCFADSTFFEVFSFKAIDGSLREALHRPFSIVLSKSAATQYFGSVNAVGKELFVETATKVYSFSVVAVIEDMPTNSHFKFRLIASYSSLRILAPRSMENWYYPPVYVYVSTKGLDKEQLDNGLKQLSSVHLPADVKEENRKFYAQPITEIHLQSNLQNELEANSNYTFIKTFTFVALFILLIACINYMNLTTAQSLNRVREIGVRKALGSARIGLVQLFLTDSLLVVTLSFALAIGVAYLAAHWVTPAILDKELSLGFLGSANGIGASAAGIVSISIFVGLYPAVYLSSFKAVNAIKGKLGEIKSGLGFRKWLVGAQFFISTVLLIALWIVMKQTDYLRTKNLGFQKENLLTISLSDRESQTNYNNLRDELMRQSFVENVSVSATLPGKDGFYLWQVKPEGQESNEDIFLKSVNTDEHFIKTYGIKILAGRDFSEEFVTDKEGAFIINEAAAKKFGWSDPIGKEIEVTYYINDAVIRKGKVIGLTEDFHYQSLYNSVEPLIILVNTHPNYVDFLSVRLKPGHLKDQIGNLKEVWHAFNSTKPFEFSFLDQELDHQYKNDETTSKLLKAFTVISIFIASIGLFGLASFAVEQRTKEIGIRKVLGASVNSILRLISKDFVVLISVASLLAWPIAWYGMREWLKTFPYRVDILLDTFFETSFIIIVIAMIIVSLRSFRTALMNPVRSLRQE